MVPDKFNMVDMGGIDLIMMQGETVPNLYQRLVESIAQCRYQCLYNWIFDGVQIPPTYVQLEIDTDTGDVLINEGIHVTEEDVIHIYSEEEPPLEILVVDRNGNYIPSEGFYGFSEVEVNVPSPLLETITITQNGVYEPEEYGFSEVTVNVSQPQGNAWLDFMVSAAYSQYLPPVVISENNIFTYLSWEASVS